MMRREPHYFTFDLSTHLTIPFYKEGLYAGFESPALNYHALPIDLNMALLLDSNNRIFEVIDNDLAGAKVYNGDWAVIDTDLQEVAGDKISCTLYGEDVNRIYRRNDARKYILSATDQRIKEQVLDKDVDYKLNGIITYTITPHVYSKLKYNGINDGSVDLNKLLIGKRASTFFALVEGESMIDAKIHHGDLAVIDRSLPYVNGRKALCRIGDMFTVKYLQWENEILWLKPANPDIPPVKVSDDQTVEVWGIVTYTITPHKRIFI